MTTISEGEMWNALPHEARNKYEAMAEEDKNRSLVKICNLYSNLFRYDSERSNKGLSLKISKKDQQQQKQQLKASTAVSQRLQSSSAVATLSLRLLVR